MGVRESVFGSKAERRCFAKLQKVWGGKFNLYHNLPFLNVITAKDTLMIDGWTTFRITDEEFELLKKTSIDFTICDKNDAPLVCVEFDGLQDGFNVGSEYRLPDNKSGRPGRRRLLELKLRAAHGSAFPYFVLGSEQFRGLSESVRLSIVDGLIGEVMSNRARAEKISEGFDPNIYDFTQDQFDALSEAQQREIVEDWMIGVEVDCDYSHNPIFVAAARLSKEVNWTGHSWAFLNDEQLDRDNWVSVECEVTNRHGAANAKVILPNSKTPFCYVPIHVAQEVARLIALEKLRVHSKRSSPTS